MSQRIDIGVHQAAQGRVRCQVVDGKTKKVKRDYGWQKNLILNQGLDQIGYLTTWAYCFYYCAIGTGTVPTSDDSGSVLASQAGDVVTLSGAGYRFTETVNDAGNFIKWDSGQEAKILAVINPSTVQVNTSATIGASEFTVYRANQTGLTNEVKRGNQYLIGTGSTGTTYDLPNSLVKFRRTFDYVPEASPITYAEVGFSYNLSAGSNLFSRVKLISPVSCASGEQIRVIYELWVTVSPCTQRNITPVITGWTGTDGYEIIESLMMDVVSSSGYAQGLSGGDPIKLILDPANLSLNRVMVSKSTANLLTSTTASTIETGSGLVKVISLSTYNNGSYTRSKLATFTPADGEYLDIRTIMMCSWTTNVGIYDRSLTFRLNNPQNKLATHNLNLEFKFTWSRILS